jgi:hypothetical protein
MIFWRTYNNQIHPIGEVEQLGFPIEDPSYIPDDYLEGQKFIILRTCFGVGDWGIISSFPRKLKEKYPNCTVLLPSPTLLQNMFGEFKSNWSSWDNPFNVVKTIFLNNPYVDGYVDNFEGDIFNDHYRIYKQDEDTPLLEQILRFWQFDSFDNIEPEIYWTDEEIKLGDRIISEHCDGEFGTLLISNRYENEGKELIQSKIDEFDLPMFYWLNNPNVEFTFKKALDLRHIDIRIQMYIKSRAKYNIGNQTGVNDTIANYAPTYTVPRGKLGSNFIKSEIYLR